MDPNQALRDIRAAIHGSDYLRACELFEDLDKWLTSSGYFPGDWHSPVRQRPSYDGFDCRETWCANLWLNNTEELYDAARGVVAFGTDIEASDNLQNWFEELVHSAAHQVMRNDIGSLWRVDWLSIARSLRAE